ncbi:MAG: hemerythrin domain-containing protein, partial [Candidatus Eisenbacteria bacterium]|nr:hemerythrin domain-containing protein [Candidatus Eisenbacteria bacterium]
MNNVSKMLKEDHRRVQELFQRFDATEEEQERQEIARNAIQELDVHAALEEELVYPFLREEDVEMDKLHEANEEHYVAHLLIGELRDMQPRDPAFAAKFRVLAESVRHHIKEEESQILPKLDKADGDLEALEERVLARKEELMAQKQNGRNGSARSRGGRTGQPRGTARRAQEQEGPIAAGPDLSSRSRARAGRR